MKLRTFRVYRVHQRRYVLGRGELGNAVAEIENAATSVSVAGQYLGRLPAYDFRRRQEHSRVEIALHGDAITDSSARLSDIDGPVETQRIGPALRETLEPRAPALGAYDAAD